MTDNDGNTGVATRAVTITNRLPSASFTATPTAALTRQTVSFNAAASSDPDGTLAQYAWDLDGNGSYETVTGTTATTTRVYTAPGTVNVGLRVTDNNGGTATATRAVTVQSAYAQQVLGTAGLRGYWRLADTGTTAADSSTSANPGTFVNGPLSVAAIITGETNAARDFDGVNDHVNLSPTPVGTPTSFSAEAWVRTGSTKGAGGFHYLITDAATDFNDGFSLAIDSSNRATFVVVPKRRTRAGRRRARSRSHRTRPTTSSAPTTAAWCVYTWTVPWWRASPSPVVPPGAARATSCSAARSRAPRRRPPSSTESSTRRRCTTPRWRPGPSPRTTTPEGPRPPRERAILSRC